MSFSDKKTNFYCRQFVLTSDAPGGNGRTVFLSNSDWKKIQVQNSSQSFVKSNTSTKPLSEPILKLPPPDKCGPGLLG